MGTPAKDKVIDLAAEVEARRLAEAEQLTPPAEKTTSAGGPDDPRFVLQCLEENERGDGKLYAALHRGKFVYVKSRDEKSTAWFRWAGHHWEADKGDFHFAAVEDVALIYQREADKLRDPIKAARDLSSQAASLTKQLKQMQRDEASDEDLASVVAMLKDAESASLELKRLTRHKKDFTDRVDRLRSLPGVKKCVEFAHKLGADGLFIYGDEIDKNPNLLPCLNGVIDLETGELKDGRPEDFMVRAIKINYNPKAPRPAWLKFFSEIHQDNADKAACVKRWFGYCLTGHVSEQFYTIFTGGGANGKGTMVEIIGEIMGELAKPVMAEMFIKSKNVRSSTGASPDILGMQGRRWIYVDETNDGDKIDAAELKKTTGGNKRTGRGLFDRYETDFTPTAKLSIITNHPPRGITEHFSVKRRLIFLDYPLRYVRDVAASTATDPGNAPFYRPIDQHLPEKLRAEEEGIFAWMVEAALEWKLNGLAVPPCLLQAVEEVAEKEDMLGQFIHAKAEIGSDYEMPAKDFLAAYQKWYIEEGHPERWKPTRNATYDQLRSKGYRIPDNRTTSGTTKIFGLDLKVI
jgi:putative DNA primase/helicase